MSRESGLQNDFFGKTLGEERNNYYTTAKLHDEVAAQQQALALEKEMVGMHEEARKLRNQSRKNRSEAKILRRQARAANHHLRRLEVKLLQKFLGSTERL